MMRAGKLCFVLLLIVSNASGCWNLKEPDQLAFDVASGMDITKDGQFEFSAQIAIPAGIGMAPEGGGGGKKDFIVIGSAGKNIYDAIQNLQTKVSRKIFLGHREVILIGRRMAEQGIGDLLDEFVRNPKSEMRSRMYVVKNADAKDILSLEPIFDPITSTGIVNKQETSGLKKYYFRDFLSDALSQKSAIMLPAVSLTRTPTYLYTGNAIFTKHHGLKLAGFLNTQESFYANWIVNKQAELAITSFVYQGNGNVSLHLESVNRRIIVKMLDQQIQIDVRLTGKGSIVENNSSLNPATPKDLQIIQDSLNQSAHASIQQLIAKAQKQLKTDFFGFDESVRQKYPHQWKTLKSKWNETFPDIDVSVHVNLQCKNMGQANSSIKAIP
ncbi:hypothetical protein SD70_13640 [Gordoniibacillus kamchatkensis]|uniref:Ger(X)C family spore germination protein n=1 Tax=Gordoniibacillus kamchatkensis TaxID=1590651 RepID=A0ABR5AHQ9_9BACL|nr:Ger(x)C family spore germination protein [Paenibacillus sp. VKM B-2647]KIL40447.1 hypothetical protein SD70_13640 [Paenibacillus sp. VKM B-2647]